MVSGKVSTGNEDLSVLKEDADELLRFGDKITDDGSGFYEFPSANLQGGVRKGSFKLIRFFCVIFHMHTLDGGMFAPKSDAKVKVFEGRNS